MGQGLNVEVLSHVPSQTVAMKVFSLLPGIIVMLIILFFANDVQRACLPGASVSSTSDLSGPSYKPQVGKVCKVNFETIDTMGHCQCH